MISRKPALLVLMFLMPVSAGWAADSGFAGKVYYRYKDAKGELVITNALPSDQARRGYEVIDKQGRVIQTVRGDDFKSEKKQALDEEQRKKDQQDYDVSLLRRYSFVADIEAEKKRKLDELNATLSIVKGNLNSVRSQLEAEYERAAEIERQGKPIPDDLKQKISDVEAALISTEDLYKLREKDIETASADYDRAINRFKELQVLRGKVRPDS